MTVCIDLCMYFRIHDLGDKVPCFPIVVKSTEYYWFLIDDNNCGGQRGIVIIDNEFPRSLSLNVTIACGRPSTLAP